MFARSSCVHLARESLAALGEASSGSWHPAGNGTVLGVGSSRERQPFLARGHRRGVPPVLPAQRPDPKPPAGSLPAALPPLRRCPWCWRRRSRRCPRCWTGAVPALQPAAQRPRGLAVRGAAGERARARLGGHGWLSYKQPGGAQPEASSCPRRGRRRSSGHGYSGAPDLLSRVGRPLPHHGTPALRRTLLPREESFVCGIFLPTFGTGPGREGAAAGAGGGEGGSYLLLIYLFSSFLPQVAMVIPSSLSLRSKWDGHPFASSTPSPPLLFPPLLSRCPSSPAEVLSPPWPPSGAGGAPPPQPGSGSFQPGPGSPQRYPGSPQPRPGCPRRFPAALGAPSLRPARPQLLAAQPPPAALPEEEWDGSSQNSIPLHPRFEVLPGFGAAAGAPLGRGRPGGTSSPVAPARGCPLSSPEAKGGRRSPGPVAAAALCPRTRGRGSHAGGSHDGSWKRSSPGPARPPAVFPLGRCSPAASSPLAQRKAAEAARPPVT